MFYEYKEISEKTATLALDNRAAWVAVSILMREGAHYDQDDSEKWVISEIMWDLVDAAEYAPRGEDNRFSFCLDREKKVNQEVIDVLLQELKSEKFREDKQ